jgi:N-acetylmuramoyl-L-alanine amidase
MVRRFAFFLALVVCTVSTDAKMKRRSAARISVSSGPFSTVVIDPGHGGFDRGGIRQNIIPEKGVVLDVSLRLSRALQQAGIRTVLTRDSDIFVTLGQRVSDANAHPDAVFVSVHFNSGRRVGARGIETFYSSAASASLATRIHRNAMTTTSGDNRGVKRASFYVLRKPRIRAVLVECGFLTNPQDAALAKNAAYRQKLSERIAGAIVAYRDSFR